MCLPDSFLPPSALPSHFFPHLPVDHTQAAMKWRTTGLKPPGSLNHHVEEGYLEEPTNCVRHGPEKESHFHCVKPLTVWGCLLQQIALLTLMWNFLSYMRKREKGQQEWPKPSVLPAWVTFNKQGKWSIFHNDQNSSRDQHTLPLVIFSEVCIHKAVLSFLPPLIFNCLIVPCYLPRNANILTWVYHWISTWKCRAHLVTTGYRIGHS